MLQGLNRGFLVSGAVVLPTGPQTFKLLFRFKHLKYFFTLSNFSIGELEKTGKNRFYQQIFFNPGFPGKNLNTPEGFRRSRFQSNIDRIPICRKKFRSLFYLPFRNRKSFKRTFKMDLTSFSSCSVSWLSTEADIIKQREC